ncbi:DUF3885 domain-containing protein [Neobacillus massiliamazoniensis]|uniref:DUF3885 domain-containing protein n=1 Tax=Neobacillus massiliamazoniensis TaxID=1499688 RepID=A0A0U1P2S3_9BACI|nr:DUF3885 domain-containing protein [Neobacillus massiliamazoniensis]CRK84566.1 Hypothetical protein BN000_04606 [Neobacillus massiliamazoniensis]
MKDRIFKYIQRNFPNLTSDVHLRFELGEPFENGTDERINQVVTRVITLFEEVFHPEDYIYVYIKDWGMNEDIMFGNTTPEYVYQLVKDHNIEVETLFEFDEDYDEIAGQTIEIKQEYNVKIVYSQVKSITYKAILEGIGNYEQGREPSIGQSVYFISTEKDLIFHMYDDRGCIIHSNEVTKLIHMYRKYNKWLVDYWRDYFNGIFKM